MASGTIQKHTINETAAQIEHNNIDRDGKNGKKHKNKDINPELSKYNVYVDKRSKMEILDDIKNDVASFDAAYPPKRKTKDRVVTLEIEYTTPRELAPVLPYKPTKEEEDALIEKYVLNQMDTINDFLIDGESAIKEKYGKTYGTTIHYDECHYYYDKADKMYHMSRPHLHTFVTAQAEIMEKTDEKDDKGKDIYTGTGQYRINGKDALKRSTYKEINKLLDAPSQKYYGCTYEDGRGKKSEGSVEAMKAASIRAEQEAHENLKAQNEDSRVIAKAIIDKLDAQEEQIAENSKILIEQEKQKNTKQEELSDLEDKIADKNTELFMKDKPKFKRDKVLVDKEAFEAYQEHYNSRKEQKLHQEQKKLEDDKKKLEDDKIAFKQEKMQYKYQFEGQYKEDAQKYKNIQSELYVSRDELSKALDDNTISNAEIITMIQHYALFQSDSEKTALLKTCTALSKIDTYTQKSLIQRNKRLEKEKVFTEENFDFPEYESRIRDMLKKSLTYKGRTEIYQKDLLKGLWADIQRDNTDFWKSRKTVKPDAVINLDKAFTAIIPRLIQTAVQAIKTYIEMIKQAQQQQYEYDR